MHNGFATGECRLGTWLDEIKPLIASVARMMKSIRGTVDSIEEEGRDRGGMGYLV